MRLRVLDTLDLIETTAFHESFRNAYFVLVRAAAIRGDRARAISLLNRAERLSWERGWGVVIAMLLVERTRVLLADGNLSEAAALLPAFEELYAQQTAAGSGSTARIHTWKMVAKGLIAAASGHMEDAVQFLTDAFDGLLATDDRFILLIEADVPKFAPQMLGGNLRVELRVVGLDQQVVRRHPRIVETRLAQMRQHLRHLVVGRRIACLELCRRQEMIELRAGRIVHRMQQGLQFIHVAQVEA